MPCWRNVRCTYCNKSDRRRFFVAVTKRKELREKWDAILGARFKERTNSLTQPYLCKSHFNPIDFIPGTTKLKHNSVPVADTNAAEESRGGHSHSQEAFELQSLQSVKMEIDDVIFDDDDSLGGDDFGEEMPRPRKRLKDGVIGGKISNEADLMAAGGSAGGRGEIYDDDDECENGSAARHSSIKKSTAQKFLTKGIIIDVDEATEKAVQHVGTELGILWKYIAGQSVYINRELARCQNSSVTSTLPKPGVITGSFDYNCVMEGGPIPCELPDKTIGNLTLYLSPIKCAEVDGISTTAATSAITNQLLHEIFDNDPSAHMYTGANKTANGKYVFIGYPLIQGICEILNRGFNLESRNLEEAFLTRELNRIMCQVTKVLVNYFDRIRRMRRKVPATRRKGAQDGDDVHEVTPEDDDNIGMEIIDDY